jgi:hypothetical protein
LVHIILRLPVQNLQGRPAGWRPREGLMLQFKSESCFLAEFLFVLWEISLCSIQTFHCLDEAHPHYKE